ncbi:MAG: LOG family protein [Candidatus Methanomethylicia archaeon]
MINICVAAHSEGSNMNLAWRFISKLPENCRIFLGGYWGLMKDVADAALKRGLQVVFILPLNPINIPPRNKLFTIIDTGLDYRGRSVILVRCSDVVVSLGGEIGTLIELFIAYSYGKPIVILRGTGMSTDKLESTFKNAFDNRFLSKIVYVDSPEELAQKALELTQI